MNSFFARLAPIFSFLGKSSSSSVVKTNPVVAPQPIVPGAPSIPSTPSIPKVVIEPKKLYVNTDVLNLRSSPEVAANNKIGSLKRGELIFFSDSLGGWNKVTTTSGVNGWVSAQFVSDVAPMVSIEVPSANNEGFTGLTALQLVAIIPSLTTKLHEYLAVLNHTMEEFHINTPLRQAAFIAQTAHESIGYSVLIENLNYSANALIATWPSRFNQANVANYARQPEKIANRAYCNRMGNGSEESGDGWKYRGRGIIQVTGKDNHTSCGAVLGLDLVNNPELLEQPLHAFRSGAWFWNSRNLNSLADIGDFVAITKKINGGTNGLEDRQRYYTKAKSVLKI